MATNYVAGKKQISELFIKLISLIVSFSMSVSEINVAINMKIVGSGKMLITLKLVSGFDIRVQVEFSA